MSGEVSWRVRGGAVLAVASLAFRESARNRVLHALLVAMVLAIGVSYTIAFVAGGDVDALRRYELLVSLNLTAISLLGTVAAIFLGTNLIYQEIERRTVYSILARPLSRTGFLIGKYLGLAAVMGVAVAAMGGLLLAFLAVFGHWFPLKVVLALAFVYVELLVVVAVALLFSVAAHPIEGAVFAFMVALTGHVTADLNDLGAKLVEPVGGVAPGALAHVGQKALYVLYVLLPNLENFNFRTAAIHDLPVDPGHVVGALAYALLYAALMLAASSLIFRRKVL